MVGGKQGHAPCKHLTPSILKIMAVDYCVRQLARKMGGRHLPIIKGKAQPHILVCARFACSMMGGLISDLECGFGCGILVSLVVRGGEVYEELGKRMIDVCCLLELRWREQGARMLGMKERRLSYGGLEKEMELVVWELW